jgi:hypothetical protein
LLLLAFFSRTSEAAVGDYIGKTVVEVRLQSNGVELRDPALLEIIETRTGRQSGRARAQDRRPRQVQEGQRPRILRE